MLKINKSILIICLVSLFLIIGQISASDTDLMETSDTGMNDLSLNHNLTEISDDSNMNQLESNELNDANSIKTETSDDLEESIDDMIEERLKDTSGVVMANDNYSCGPASLATVLNRYGLNLSLNEVSKQTNTSVNGTTMQSLIDAAQYYGFSAYGVEIDTKSLKDYLTAMKMIPEVASMIQDAEKSLNEETEYGEAKGAIEKTLFDDGLDNV